MTEPYRSAAVAYFEAGWLGPLPLPAQAKRDPPIGYTGLNGAFPSRADIQAWVDNGVGKSNIALRLPEDVIGIDVDMYDGKQGRKTLAELEAKWGPLPDTWMSTSRDDGSGIRLYRVPLGHKWPSVAGTDIEIIQYGHRYAVVWPSVHPSGATYRWKTASGLPVSDFDRLPTPQSITDLPTRWVNGLTTLGPTEKASGWTDPDLDALVDNGVPYGVNQDEALRDVVWKLRAMGLAKKASKSVWDDIVGKTDQLDSTWPWSRKDFERHWKGADAKLPPPLTTLDDGRPDQPQERASLLLTRSELRNLPMPEPLITDTIDLRTVALVAGYWGTLKSFLAIDWACCIATGRPWMGREVKVGPVLYVAAEGAYGLGSRLDAWEAAWHRSEMIPDEMFAVYPKPINLLDAQEVAELVAMADGRALVIVDTLARCLVGGDENSARDMGVAVDSFYKVRDATDGGSVLALHHTGKDKVTTRGSSALEAGVETIYTTEGDYRHVTLTRKKRKDGPVDDIHQLILTTRLESAYISVHVGLDKTENDQRLMSTFLSSFQETGAYKADLEKVAGLPHSSYLRSLQALLSAGFLRNEGTQKRPFYVMGDPQ